MPISIGRPFCFPCATGRALFELFYNVHSWGSFLPLPALAYAGGRHQGHPWCRPRRSVTHHPRRGAASCLTAQRIRLRRAARAPLGAGQDHNVRADPLALDRLSALK